MDLKGLPDEITGTVSDSHVQMYNLQHPNASYQDFMDSWRFDLSAKGIESFRDPTYIAVPEPAVAAESLRPPGFNDADWSATKTRMYTDAMTHLEENKKKARVSWDLAATLLLQRLTKPCRDQCMTTYRSAIGQVRLTNLLRFVKDKWSPKGYFALAVAYQKLFNLNDSKGMSVLLNNINYLSEEITAIEPALKPAQGMLMALLCRITTGTQWQAILLEKAITLDYTFAEFEGMARAMILAKDSVDMPQGVVVAATASAAALPESAPYKYNLIAGQQAGQLAAQQKGCFNCKQAGHRSVDCPLPCQSCPSEAPQGQPGYHTSNVCPTRLKEQADKKAKSGKKRGKPDAASAPKSGKKKAKVAAAVAAPAGAATSSSDSGIAPVLLNSIEALRKSMEDKDQAMQARMQAAGL